MDKKKYVDLEELMKQNLNAIYQLQINNNTIIFKHIGNGSHAPDVIIREFFGKNKLLKLYNCTYTKEDLEYLTNEIHEETFLPILKLIQKIDDEKEKHNIFTISIKLKEKLQFNIMMENFDIYLTFMNDNKYIVNKKMDKILNQTNIVEKMLETIIDNGHNIL